MLVRLLIVILYDQLFSGTGSPVDGSKKPGEGRKACSGGSFSPAVEGCRSCSCWVSGVFRAIELHQSSGVCCEFGETAQVLFIMRFCDLSC